MAFSISGCVMDKYAHHRWGSTVRTEIIENGARMPRISDFGLGEKTRREDPPSALT